MRTKSFKITVACLAFALTCTLAGLPYARGEARAAEGTPIDIFLIGGQSNAVGYSVIGDFDVQGTFPNVLYAGEADRHRANGSSTAERRIEKFTDYIPVTTGLGAAKTCIGPEFGMAEALNNYYSAEHKALIFKTAAGGTSLLDTKTGSSNTYGNWYPRSRWKEGFVPNDSSPTGLLYYRFVENFRTVYNNLVAEGYSPKVKAMVWSQGSTDMESPASYEPVIKDFIRDMRADLVSITGDKALQTMPFLWADINPHFGSHNNPQVPPFVEMQNRVAEDVGGVYIVSTTDFTIVGPNGETGGTQYGYDRAHFNAHDMRLIGNRYAETYLGIKDDRIVVIYGSGDSGKVRYAFGEEGTRLVFTVSPARGYKLATFTVNGEDVTEDMERYTYVLEDPPESVVAECTFTRASRLTITYTYDHSLATVKTPMTVYEGEILSITISPVEGAEIVSVLYGEEPMTKNEETGAYEYGPLDKAEKVTITLKKGGETQEPPKDTEEEPKEEKGKGCGGAIGGGCGFALLGALGTAFALRRKK